MRDVEKFSSNELEPVSSPLDMAQMAINRAVVIQCLSSLHSLASAAYVVMCELPDTKRQKQQRKSLEAATIRQVDELRKLGLFPEEREKFFRATFCRSEDAIKKDPGAL